MSRKQNALRRAKQLRPGMYNYVSYINKTYPTLEEHNLVDFKRTLDSYIISLISLRRAVKQAIE